MCVVFVPTVASAVETTAQVGILNEIHLSAKV
jgi:hypothetical protein